MAEPTSVGPALDTDFILLLLSDSNLPTGGFVASSGLESYYTHGHLPPPLAPSTLTFISHSLPNYARTSLPFVSDAHRLLSPPSPHSLAKLHELDALCEAMTLNHVARRASRAQGVALFTLYGKAFARPKAEWEKGGPEEVVEKLKAAIRRGATPGHLPVCWGVLTGALSLPLEKSQFLHLFLNARSLLSSSVRLNTVGPYAAQQLLLRDVRPLVDEAQAEARDLRTGIVLDASPADSFSQAAVDEDMGPATTWPLGEILVGRHDSLFTRIFNS